MYRVSLAVIYTAMGRTGGSLYWPKADFKQSPMERERAERRTERKKEREREKKKEKTIAQNE